MDDTRDDCDPSRGGADCGGVCECSAIGTCAPGTTWSSSPEVCDCVATNPCALVLCPLNSQCRVVGGKAVCERSIQLDPCTGYDCALGEICTAPADRPYCIRDPRTAP